MRSSVSKLLLLGAALYAGLVFGACKNDSSRPTPPKRAAILDNPPDPVRDPLVNKLLDKLYVGTLGSSMDEADLKNLPTEFPNRPKLIEPFQKLSNSDWQIKFDAFQYRLVELADVRRMDSDSLFRCIRSLHDKHEGTTALLPVAAVSTSLHRQGAWLIVCVWEIAESHGKAGDAKNLPLSHYWVYLMRADDQQILAQSSCD